MSHKDNRNAQHAAASFDRPMLDYVRQFFLLKLK
jgi:hypothetical protein